MQYSYWEKSEWLSDIDYTIIGSGITGLNCALALRKKYPESRIRILERGTMPQGASTKNAGFASFGSISELLDDLNHTPKTIWFLSSKSAGTACKCSVRT